jgi:hypothetical protein
MIIDLQERLKKLKRALPLQTFSMEKTADHPDARRMVREALALAKGGNFSGAVEVAFASGYVTAWEEVIQTLREEREKFDEERFRDEVRSELRKQLAENYPDVYRLYLEFHNKKGEKGGEGK